jgi:hypothetical protein
MYTLCRCIQMFLNSPLAVGMAGSKLSAARCCGVTCCLFSQSNDFWSNVPCVTSHLMFIVMHVKCAL